MPAVIVLKKFRYMFFLPALLLLMVPPAALGQNTFESENEQEYRRAAFLSTHSDASGTPRPDLWVQGIEQFAELKGAQGSEPTPPRLGTTWTQIGPQPLVIDAVQIYQGVGPDSGEVVDIAIDPTGNNDSTVYVATNDGGIWKTTGGGMTWTASTDFGCPGNPASACPSLSMGAVALDPQNSQIVYAGTGNPFDGGGLFTKGLGLYKSTNGGAMWTVLNPGGIFGDGSHAGVAINRIVVWWHRPPGGTANFALLVGTNQGLFRSIDGGNHFGNNPPDFDNGMPVLGGYISDLKIDTFFRPQAVANVYVAVRGTGLFRSTDGGITFPTNFFRGAGNGTPAPGTYCFVSFAQSTKPNNQRFYASVEARDAVGGCGGPRAMVPFLGLYRSDNGGMTWAIQPGANRTGNGGSDGMTTCQCGYDQTIGVDPQDQNRVYLGFQELFRSTDGGATFTIPAVTHNLVHWDHHAIIFSPFSHWTGPPTRIWIGTDGGVASSPDGGTTWNNLNGSSRSPNNALATNLFKQIDIGHGLLGLLFPFTYGGTQDTGTIERRPGFAGNDWHLAVDGDGSAAAVSPANPRTAYGAQNGGFIFTNNGGSGWFTYAGAPPIWRYAIDPNNANNIFAIDSTRSGFSPGPNLYRSTDGGMTFGAPLANFPPTVRSIGNTHANSNLLWLGLEDGSLQRCTNALGMNPMCQAIADPSGSGRPVGGIYINPIAPSEVVIVYEGFSGANNVGHAFLTRNAGANWTDISAGLPDLPTHSVVIDPGPLPILTNTIIASNDAGVMSATDIPILNQVRPFTVLGTALPIVDSTSLAIDSSFNPLIQSVLRLGTYGRSVWELK
jgi:hypothetical protein